MRAHVRLEKQYPGSPQGKELLWAEFRSGIKEVPHMAGVPAGGQTRKQTDEIHACTPKAQVFQLALHTEQRSHL